MLIKLKKILQKTPLSPHFIANYYLEKNIATILKKLKADKVIDIGCGTKPYKKYISHKNYIGIEFLGGVHPENKKNCDVYYNGNEFPFKNNSFDLLIITQVLEHVKYHKKITQKLSKLIKPNGKLLLSVPFVSNLHEKPFDYYRFTPYSLKKILLKNNFKNIKVIKSCGMFSTIGFLLSDFFFYKICSISLFLKPFVLIFFCFPIQITFLILDILFKRKGINLDWIVTAIKK